MEARRFRAALIAAAALALLGANYRTPNFVVQTADPALAEQFAKAAETYRRDLAVAWTGEAMPDWYQPCMMTVQVGEHLGAGGATSFLFDRGEVYGWRMNIQGSAQRVLDSVLPHEITHMIFASHFRAPLPRWADEGGATNCECPSEQMKHRQMLVQFLQTGRGIAFSDMFVMTEYPADVMPLYAQGHSLVDYLLQHGGRHKYVAFLGDGMQTHDWAAALQKWYGINSLANLQNDWVGWVAKGCPRLQQTPTETAPDTQFASTRRSRPEPNLVYQVANPSGPATAEPLQTQAARPQPIQRPGQVIVE